MTNATPCKIEDCDLPSFCRSWCSKHYTRWRRYGDTSATFTHMRNASRVLPQGTQVVDTLGYVRIKVGPDWVLEHRHVMSVSLGRPLQAGENVHHRNGERSDNRLENLELWAIPQPPGGRHEEIVRHWVTRYPDLARRILAED